MRLWIVSFKTIVQLASNSPRIKPRMDSFQGKSPERKASDALRNFFTFVAVKIILAQLSGSALRVMEVRAAYCNEDFEFDQLERLSKKGIKDSNIELMRNSATASLSASLDTAPPDSVADTEGTEPTDSSPQ
eukprot:gene20842-27674_t